MIKIKRRERTRIKKKEKKRENKMIRTRRESVVTKSPLKNRLIRG